MERFFSSLLARPKFLVRADIIIKSFSTSGRAAVYILSFLIITSGTGILLLLNNALQVNVPMRGASLSEGIVGTPQFINPILALTDADRDMTTLIYSGLLRETSGGQLIPDMAENYEVSSDGRTYTVHLRPGVTFHDGVPLTADDVAFTVQKVLDPALKSPLRTNWQGVSVQVMGPSTVVFTLTQPYAPFAENLTLGILPKHLWTNVSEHEFPFSNLNTAPVGSGPFRIAGITRTPAGVATAYTLRSFGAYALGEPYLTNLTVQFYDREDALVSALQNGSVESGSSISPALVNTLANAAVLTSPLDRVFGVFFNQNNNVALQDKTVRRALGDAIDRNALISQALDGYAIPLAGPIPPSLMGADAATSQEKATSTIDGTQLARKELLDAGWTAGPGGILQKTTGSGKSAKTTVLSFTLTTSNVPELRAVAERLAAAWKAVGANVTVQVFEAGDLSENIIRPRKYDALLFGEIIGRGLDLFAFWDSSERNDPGLNIAMYANPTVDSVLAKLRTSTNDAERQDLYTQLESEITRDSPAVFLYSPEFVYVVPKDLKGITLGPIESASDRFDSVTKWYRQTDRVWNVFVSAE